MPEEEKKKVDWVAISSDEDAEDIEETQKPTEDDKKSAVPSVNKGQKPNVVAWSEREHNRGKYSKRVKGGFKPELAQKKAVHLKAGKNPFDIVDDEEEENQNQDSDSDQEAEGEGEAQQDNKQSEINADLTEEQVKAQKEKQQNDKVLRSELKEAQAEQNRKLQEAVSKAEKQADERARAKAEKKELKKKKDEEDNLDDFMKDIENVGKKAKKPKQKASEDQPKEGEVQEKKKPKAAEPKKQEAVETKPQVQAEPSAPQQILSIQEVLKKKAKQATSKAGKKKPDLGAAKREIEDRNAKQKVKKVKEDL